MTTKKALDRAVAEKIMGWSFDSETDCPVCGWVYALTLCTPENCSERPVPAKRADIPPAYSTDPRAAMLVVEEMRKTHFVRIEFLRDAAISWMRRYDNPQHYQVADQNWMRAVLLCSLRANSFSIEGL